jgi:hypothetical protein
MAKLKYKTQSVNTEIDPRGGYICRVVVTFANGLSSERDVMFKEHI